MGVEFPAWQSSLRTTQSPTARESEGRTLPRGSYVTAGSQRRRVSHPSPLEG